jgi:hypothetical protein
MQNSGAIDRTGVLHGDRSLTFLLLTNLAVLAGAVSQHWNVTDLLWIGWGQSVIIGYYNVYRIVDLDRFSTDSFLTSIHPFKSSCETQRCMAVGFALHYGLFHLVYGIFLLTTFRIQPDIPLYGLMLCVLAFWFTHRYSYHYNRERDRDVPNITTLLFFPYARVVPMNVVLLLGARYVGGDVLALALLLIIKTAVDVAMHVIEHMLARADARRVSRRLS